MRARIVLTGLVVVLAILPIAIFVGRGITADVSLGAQSTTVATPAATQTPANAETELLRAQLEQMRSFDERLLATVYWSLAGAVTVVVAGGGLLVGFGWFANMRNYDRDRKALETDIQSRIAAESGKLQTDFQRRADEVIAATVAQIQGDIRVLQADLQLTRAQSWEERERPDLALDLYLQMWETLQEAKRLPGLAPTLDSVKRLIDSGVPIDAELSSRIFKLLEGLPVELTLQKDLIPRSIAQQRPSPR